MGGLGTDIELLVRDSSHNLNKRPIHMYPKPQRKHLSNKSLHESKHTTALACQDENSLQNDIVIHD